jgi:predicted nucleic acid-binding protein
MMPARRSILVDSGALLAMADPRDRYAAAARRFLEVMTDAFYVVPDTVFSEAMTLVKARLGAAAAVSVGSRLQESTLFQLRYLEPGDHRAAWQIFARYMDKDWSYVDCSILAFAQRQGIEEVFAFDHHFDQMIALGLSRVPRLDV